MRQETIIMVLQTYENHFPFFFKNKTDEDKVRLATDWFQIFNEIDDDTFIKACGNLVKESDYFPNSKEIFKEVENVKIRNDFELTQKKFDLYNLVEKANWSGEDIERLAFIDSMWESEESFTEADFTTDKLEAIVTLKQEYGLTEEQINKFGTMLKESEMDAGKKEHFKNWLYDVIVLKTKGIEG